MQPGIVDTPYVNTNVGTGLNQLADRMNQFSKRRQDNRQKALDLQSENTGVMKKRYVNSKVNELLNISPNAAVAAVGNPGEEGYVAGTAAESPDDYSLRVKQGMGEIADIDPMVALGLSKKITDPYREQSNADRLFGFQQTKEQNTKDYRDTVTAETGRHNVSGENQKTVTHPDTGETLGWNSATGEYDVPVFEGIDPYRIGGTKNPLVKVTDRDGLGTETTRNEPKYILGADGNYVINPNLDSVKRPTLAQKDIGFIDGYGSNRKDLLNMTDIVNDENSEDIFGITEPVQNWLAKTLDTETGKKAASFDSIRAKLMTGLTGQLSGALSDKDMAFIENQMPSQSFTRDQNIVRMNNINERVGQRQAASLSRLKQSNPAAVENAYQKMSTGEIAVPFGYKIQSNGSEYRLVKN